MANIQKQFKEFNTIIRLDLEHHETLREKRNIIRDKVEKRLPGVFAKYGEECPEFTFYDQGSYEMHTGINPLTGDFDIDQGLYFKVATTGTYADPVLLKKRVHEALVGHTDNVCIRRSCVTAFYHKDGEAIYHVDIAVYSDKSCNADGKSKLAKGKENSGAAHRIWEISDPKALTDTIIGKYTETVDRHQFRRIVRYLKRWKIESFPEEGNAAPLGIGLTVAVHKYLPAGYTNNFANTPDDLGALRTVISGMLGGFSNVWDDATKSYVRRLQMPLPVEPWGDLFARMSPAQMLAFEENLKSLLAALDYAEKSPDPSDACTKLNKELSVDFPIPPKEETAKSHAPAISYSGNSA